ncbi:MAG: hypothetical protein IJM30_12720 [Thermoguttaceae bacterium]|nr:hypothetical protein [Thermoguttaceae bacterium]
MKNSRFDNYLLKGRKLSLEPLESRALLSANPAFCGPPSREQWLASDSRADVVCVVSAAETEPTDYCLVSNRVAELLQPGPPSLGQYEFIREVLRGLKEERVFDDGAFGAWLSDSDSYGFDSSLALIAEHIGSADSDSESNANLEPDVSADPDDIPDDVTEPDVDAEPNANPNSESDDNPEVNDESDVDDDESDDSRVPRDRSGGENWENFNISLVNLHTSADQNAFNVVNPIMECRGLASPSSFVDFNEFDYDYALVELPAPPLYYECHATATADTGGINSQFVILKKVGDSFEQPTTLDYSGGSNLLYIVPIKNSLTSNMTITIDLYTPILPGVSGGNQEQEVISSISITVIKSRPRASVSWQQDEANGAPLTASPQGGLRIYPEQENIYAYSLKIAI